MVNSLWFFFKRLDQKVIFRTFSCDDGVFSLFSALWKRGTGFRDLLIDQGRAHVQKGFFGQTIRVTCVVDCQEFICTVTFIWLQDQGKKKIFLKWCDFACMRLLNHLKKELIFVYSFLQDIFPLHKNRCLSGSLEVPVFVYGGHVHHDHPLPPPLLWWFEPDQGQSTESGNLQL